MLGREPEFVFGNFEYEVIAENVLKISCGPTWSMCTTIRDFERGAKLGLLTIAEWRAKRQVERLDTVVPLRVAAPRRGRKH